METPPTEAFPNIDKFMDGFTIVIIMSVISSLVGLAIIGFIAYKCAKNGREVIVQDLQRVVTGARNNRPHNPVPFWEVSTPTMGSTPPPPSPPTPRPSENNSILQPTKLVQVRGATAASMEKFIQEMEAAKPVRFAAEHLKKFTNDYQTRLGAGGFGEVYKGQFPDGVRIAVKVIKKRLDKRAEEQFMAEVGTIGRTYHINLLRLCGFCYDKNISALVYEYMENGSLDKYLFKESKAKAIKWDKLQQIAIGTAKGLAYLHEGCQKRIIHYDIKPENILLDEAFIPKVGDFGLARLCNRDSSHVSLAENNRGTVGYSAPEIHFKNHPITYKCDVYSFGMVLFEIISRRRNTIVHSSQDSLDFFPQHVWDKYEKGELGSMTKACGIEEKHKEEVERMCMVALWCVQDLPQVRPQMSDVVKMLEGGVEILPPAKPFQYLFPVRTAGLNPVLESVADDSSTGTSEEIQSRWYKEYTTPIMGKQEIEIKTV